MAQNLVEKKREFFISFPERGGGEEVKKNETIDIFSSLSWKLKWAQFVKSVFLSLCLYTFYISYLKQIDQFNQTWL